MTSSFKDLIEGKKVILIGPAPYLLDSNAISEKVSSFDTVVRLNRSVDVLREHSRFLGEKIDILYHCLDVNPAHGNHDYCVLDWKALGVAHVRIPYPPVNNYYTKNIDKFLRKNKKTIPASVVHPDTYVEIVRGCSMTSPNTGTIAIIDILRSNPELLHISGMTFLQGEKIYVDGYRDVTNSEAAVREQNAIHKNHSIDRQIEFLRKELKKYNNLCYDDEVLSSLYGDKGTT